TNTPEFTTTPATTTPATTTPATTTQGTTTPATSTPATTPEICVKTNGMGNPQKINAEEIEIDDSPVNGEGQNLIPGSDSPYTANPTSGTVTIDIPFAQDTDIEIVKIALADTFNVKNIIDVVVYTTDGETKTVTDIESALEVTSEGDFKDFTLEFLEIGSFVSITLEVENSGIYMIGSLDVVACFKSVETTPTIPPTTPETTTPATTTPATTAPATT
ncbi:unnamed protein product, partial [Owenia fusiformis]